MNVCRQSKCATGQVCFCQVFSMMQFFFNSVKTDVMFKSIFKSANKRPNISLQNCKISEG